MGNKRKSFSYMVIFPLSLVLYEFSTYIGNDMIQPGCWQSWLNSGLMFPGCLAP